MSANTIMQRIIDQVCLHPHLYAGRSLYEVQTFLNGAEWALLDQGLATLPPPLGRFQRWCEGTHGINHPAWSWPRILHHMHSTEESAISALPREFARSVSELADVSDLEAWAEQRTPSGSQPATTHTPGPA